MAFFLFYFTGLVFLTAMGLIYRVIFFCYYAREAVGLTLGQKIYALFWGVQFDLSIAAYCTAVVAVVTYLGLRLTPWRRGWRYLYIIFIALILCFITADIMYFQNSGRHIGYEVSDFGADAWALITTGFSGFPGLFIGTMIGIIVASMVLLTLLRRWVRWPMRFSIRQLEIPFLFIALVSVLLIRGGPYRAISLAPQDVYQVGNAEQALLAYNAAFAGVYYSINSEHAHVLPVPLPSMSPTQVSAILPQLYPQHDTALNIAHLRKMNIVVVMLESWPAMYMKSYGYDKDVTPFFDSLRKTSFTALGMISDGHRTSEGVTATFCSYPNPLGETIAQSQLTFYHYHCLPEVLRDHGWDTAFFEGTSVDTGGVGPWVMQIGFSHAYGDMDIGRAITAQYPKNRWGYQDPDQYRYILQMATTMHQPFLIGINTTSSHDDQLPPGITSAFGMDNALERKISVQHFSDQALQQFLADYAKLKNIGPTLFIIEADHTADIASPASHLQQYFIPFLMFASDGSVPTTMLNRMVSQRDISPTIMDFLGGYVPWFTGKSMLSSTHAPYFANYYDPGTLGWVVGNRVVEQDTNSGKVRCYDWPNNMTLQTISSCGADDKVLQQQSLAFVTHSQQWLFEGKTTEFFSGLVASANH